VAKHLNDMGIKAPGGGLWGPNTVCKVIRRRCYSGKNVYNSGAMVPNPERPLGDVSGQVKRTIRRPKPSEDWVFYKVPQLVSEELWEKANAALTERGRGRGKQGKAIQALLRNRIFCPRCGLPMVVRREGDSKKIFYHCARHYRKWDGKACGFRKFISARWDDYVWDCVHALLCDDIWMEQQLAGEQKTQEVASKLVEVEERKLTQFHTRITRVQAGYEDGIYDTSEAKKRIKACQEAIAVTEKAIARRQREAGAAGASESGIASLRQRLESIRHTNLKSASFEEMVQMIGLLDIKVYPSEDLKTVRIASRIGVNPDSVDYNEKHCGKVLFAPLYGTRTKLSKSKLRPESSMY